MWPTNKIHLKVWPNNHNKNHTWKCDQTITITITCESVTTQRTITRIQFVWQEDWAGQSKIWNLMRCDEEVKRKATLIEVPCEKRRQGIPQFWKFLSLQPLLKSSLVKRPGGMMGDSEGGMETLSTSPSNCSRILSRVISILKREGNEEESTSTFYLSGFHLLVLAF